MMNSHYELQPGAVPRIFELLEAFYRNNLNVGTWAAFCDKMMFFQLLHETVLACRSRNGDFGVKERIEESVDYLRNRYMDPITVPDLAARCGMSVNYYSIRFRKQTGISPMEYLIQIRLKRSIELLSDSGLAVKEIAKLVGYADVYYFSRLFKKHIGYPPRPCCAVFARRSGVKTAGDLPVMAPSYRMPKVRNASVHSIPSCSALRTVFSPGQLDPLPLFHRSDIADVTVYGPIAVRLAVPLSLFLLVPYLKR